MRFSFVAKHRVIWPVSWICEALGVSRSGFHAWLNRSPNRRAQYDEVLVAGIRSSFAGSDRTYGARRVWHDVLAEGLDAGLHCQSAPDKDPLSASNRDPSDRFELVRRSIAGQGCGAVAEQRACLG